MDTSPTTIVDLITLIDRLKTLSNYPNDPNAPGPIALLGQAARRLRHNGHIDVDLLGVISTCQTPPDPHGYLSRFEGNAFALRQGTTVVGWCGGRNVTELTDTAEAHVKKSKTAHTLPLTTCVVSGEAALARCPMLSPTKEAHVNAMVDQMCLTAAVPATTTISAPGHRM